MKKFLTGLRYGTWSTRLYVISIPIAFLIGIGAIIAAFIFNFMLLFLTGVAVIIGGITLIVNYNIDESIVEEVEPESINREPEEQEPEEQEPEERIPKEQVSEEPKAEEQEPERQNHEREEELLSYDEKAVKQVFYKYKVKKDHKTIMIDSWEEKGIKQMPAYIWNGKGQLHILTVGQNVQEYTMPLSKTGKLSYKRGIICQAKEEYIQFRKASLLSTVFTKYLPVYHKGNKDHRPVIYKNLFAFENGLMVTNTSVKTISELLHPQFEIDDIVMRDVRYNGFFKEIYKLGILFREQVYSVKEYQNLVNGVLQNFAESGIMKEEYESTLQALYQNKLITQEYIQFYLQYWNQCQGKTSEDVKKRKRKKKK